MPIARVQGPDGKTYKIEVPKGATEQDILSFAESQFGNQQNTQNQQEQKYDSSFLENFARGLGKSVTDTTAGLAQAGLGALGSAAGAVGADDVQKSLEGGANIIGYRDQQEDLMKTTGGQLGNIAGSVGQMALPAKYITAGLKAIPAVAKAAPILGDVLSSAGYGAAQPVKGDDQLYQRAENSLISGGLAGIGRGMVGLAGKGIQAASDPLIKAAEKYGIPLGLSQTSPHALVRTIGKLSENVGLISPKQKIQESLNKAVSKSIGESADRIDDAVLSSAEKRLGDVFNNAAKYGIKDATAISQRMADILRNGSNEFMPPQLQKVGTVVKDVSSLIKDNSISPKATKNISESLRSMAYEETDPVVSKAIREVSNEIENSLAQNLPKQEFDDLMQARRQYKALKLIKPLAEKNIGNIPPSQLLQRVVTEYGDAEAAGGLGEVAQIASKYLKQSVPDSGTATNAAILARLGFPIAGIAGGASGQFDPMSAAALTAAGTIGSAAFSSPLARKAATKMLKGITNIQPQYALPAEYLGGEK